MSNNDRFSCSSAGFLVYPKSAALGTIARATQYSYLVEEDRGSWPKVGIREKGLTALDSSA